MSLTHARFYYNEARAHMIRAMAEAEHVGLIEQAAMAVLHWRRILDRKLEQSRAVRTP